MKLNMLTHAFAKFIKRERVYCDHDACCLCYGTHVAEYPDGMVLLLCDKHADRYGFLKQPTTKETQCQLHQ